MATFAVAQTLPHFDHVIIIVQENRTPDNLFGAAPAGTQCGHRDPFEPGVDIQDGGKVNGQVRCLAALPLSGWDATLNQIVDPDHSYNYNNLGWVADYDNGAMDGFCHMFGSTCPEYSYVPKSDVQPYFDIATNYGFANYLFQTNEGPSFPAHQFLFTGTSAPVAPGDTSGYDVDFVGENPQTADGFFDAGCQEGFSGSTNPQWVDPFGTEFRKKWYECYTHDSLVTNSNCVNGVCDNGASWRYYTPTPEIIWTAPAGIPEVCYGENDLKYAGNPCGSQGNEWGHVTLPAPTDGAPIFNDIKNCNLPQITYVIPDEAWSDHPQHAWKKDFGNVYGPSWVGDIIDAIGNSYANSGNKCDYWGYPATGVTPEPTAIFVVWDDWGGWFDHVPPFAVNRDQIINGKAVCNAPNGWGCGYTYGFRVPLLVVSEYTKAGYVSGSCDLTGCNNDKFPYQHDFGSILRFTELNFNMPPIDRADKGYADYNAPDNNQPVGNIPLSDFFNLNNQRSFTNISTQEPPSYFQGYYQNNPGYPPTGPDGAAPRTDEGGLAAHAAARARNWHRPRRLFETVL